MEVCGTHTHNIFQFGIPSILPPNIELVSGPGCPVCVTSPAYIDMAAKLALQKNAAVYAFGDMIRVPGHKTSLQKAKAEGGDVRIMYSPSDVLKTAKRVTHFSIVKSLHLLLQIH
jgi:hydrogenase expression/formation protein HypD